MPNSTALHIVSLLMDHFETSYGNPQYVLIYTVTQFSNKFFYLLCMLLGTELSTSTAFTTKTSKYIRRNNKTTIGR